MPSAEKHHKTMSAVIPIPINRKALSQTIEPDSLLDHLFTNYGLQELVELQNKQTVSEYLLAWNVSAIEFNTVLNKAIELVKND